jgi:hypothetical protein
MILRVVLVVAVATLALPVAADARWTAWKVSAVKHETTWDWRDTDTACTSADPVVLAEQGSRKVVSFKPKQVHRVARRLKNGRKDPGLGGGIRHTYGPTGDIDGTGKVAVHAVQITQPCQITGYDETGDPSFGPDGAPVTDTCDTTVSGRLRTMSFLPRLGRIGRKIVVDLREDIGAEPSCETRSGFGILGPDPLGGSIPRKRLALSRFYGTRSKVSLKHTRRGTTPTAGTTIVGTTTTTGKVTLTRITRPEHCFYGRKNVPASVRRHFVCTA